MKKTGFLALLLAALVICGCAFAAESDPVVIRVGDSVVRLSAAQAYFDDLYAQYSAFYANYGQSIPEEDIAQIRDDTIQGLSQVALLDGKVEEFGLGQISDADRQALAEECATIYEESVRAEAEDRGVPVEQVKEERASYGMTLEFELANMLEMLPYTRLYNHVTENVQVDDSALQKSYETFVQQDKDLYANDVVQYEFNLGFANATTFFRPDGYRAIQHILLPVPEELAFEIQNAQADLVEMDDAIAALNEELTAIQNGGESTRTTEQVEADIERTQQERAQQEQVCEAAKAQILPQLQETIAEINDMLAAGESFEAISAQYSRDESFPAQADGSCFVHKDSILFDTAFRDAAMSLEKVGDYALGVTDHGVYVVQYVSDIAGGPVPMDDQIADTLRSTLLEDAKYAFYEETFSKWQQENPVETHPELIVIPAESALPTEGVPDGNIANPAEADGSIG